MPLGIISSSPGMASPCRIINNSVASLRRIKNGSSICLCVSRKVHVKKAFTPCYRRKVLCVPAREPLHQVVQRTDHRSCRNGGESNFLRGGWPVSRSLKLHRKPYRVLDDRCARHSTG